MRRPDLLSILQCPSTQGCLDFTSNELRNESGTKGYPIIHGVPVFSEEASNVRVHAVDHLSNTISADAQRVIEQAEGLVLNLSAGGSTERHPRVVELEYSIFRHTDVVGDAHALPFKDCVFGACICMNAFEHYREPRRVALEILRVLKPGGTLFMHTAALQPLHEPPHHYYNVTRFGLAEWLKGFDIDYIRVSDNFNPAYALSWLVSEIERGVFANQGMIQSLHLRNAKLGKVLKFWRDPSSRRGSLWSIFENLDPHTRETCAAGWEAKMRKPGH
jgi:SAM-dependent methyltransferase